MSFGNYGDDVLSGDWKNTNRKVIRTVPADRDLVVEEIASGFCGAVLRVENKLVQLEDFRGKVRVFPLGGGFLLEGEPIILAGPSKAAPAGKARTASGSFAVADQKARVALPSRIFVEGRHDAELVEKVWGADLRVEGVVVEYLEGVDDLDAIIRNFAPNRGRRVGVLVDHLVPNSKESRIADAVTRGPFGANVLVVGHPFVDIWQSVKPARLGLKEWPTIPRSIEWKHGICEALGWPHEEQADIARAWQRILGQVRTFADLEPVVLGRVEQLIDFVTEPVP
jgi:predicted methyltransferase